MACFYWLTIKDGQHDAKCRSLEVNNRKSLHSKTKTVCVIEYMDSSSSMYVTLTFWPASQWWKHITNGSVNPKRGLIRNYNHMHYTNKKVIGCITWCVGGCEYFCQSQYTHCPEQTIAYYNWLRVVGVYKIYCSNIECPIIREVYRSLESTQIQS